MSKKKLSPKAELKATRTRILVVEGQNVFLTEKLRQAHRVVGELRRGIYPFTFENEPSQFQGTDASFTQCYLKDVEVRNARIVYKGSEILT